MVVSGDERRHKRRVQLEPERFCSLRYLRFLLFACSAYRGGDHSLSERSSVPMGWP